MNRRTAIRYLAAASAGAVLFPACREVPVLEQYSLADGLRLNATHQDYLETILQSLLPLPESVRTEIEEQEGRSRVSFVQTMLNDLHPAEEVARYTEGFAAFERFLTANELALRAEDAAATVALVEATLEEAPAPAVADPAMTPEQAATQAEAREYMLYFIQKSVELARRHLAGSGYYLQNYLDYQLIPPPFQGAVDV